MKFSRPGGEHVDEKGLRYEKDEVFESDLPLDELFDNAFVRHPDDTPIKVKGKPYTQQAIAKARREELQAPPPAEESQETTEETESQPGSEVPESTLGENVTDQFPGAAEKGLMVVKDGRKHHVVNMEDPNQPLHDKPLATKRDVTDFVEQHTQVPDEQPPLGTGPEDGPLEE